MHIFDPKPYIASSILQVGSTSLFDGFRRVIPMDEIFEVIQSVHQKSTAHSGVQKTFEIVSDATCMHKVMLCCTLTCRYHQTMKDILGAVCRSTVSYVKYVPVRSHKYQKLL